MKWLTMEFHQTQYLPVRESISQKKVVGKYSQSLYSEQSPFVYEGRMAEEMAEEFDSSLRPYQ